MKAYVIKVKKNGYVGACDDVGVSLNEALLFKTKKLALSNLYTEEGETIVQVEIKIIKKD